MISPCTDQQLSEVASLLVRNGLPADDIASPSLDLWVFVGDDQSVGGCVGMERFSSCALLRSLAVRADLRGQALGKKLTEHIENEAASDGLSGVWLLTETADRFFTKLGYRVADREIAPPEIKSTTQFTTLCGEAATLMRKDLG